MTASTTHRRRRGDAGGDDASGRAAPRAWRDVGGHGCAWPAPLRPRDIQRAAARADDELVGMVAAGAATEAVIARYGPRAILNYGCTGAHREDILLGDVVVGTACVAYDHGRLRAGGTFEHTPKRSARGRHDETRCVPDECGAPRRRGIRRGPRAVAGEEPWPEGGRASARLLRPGRLGGSLHAGCRRLARPARAPRHALRRHGGGGHRADLRPPRSPLPDRSRTSRTTSFMLSRPSGRRAPSRPSKPNSANAPPRSSSPSSNISQPCLMNRQQFRREVDSGGGL